MVMSLRLPPIEGAIMITGLSEAFVTLPVAELSPPPADPEFKKPWVMLAPIAMPEPLTGSTFSPVYCAVPAAEMKPLLVNMPVIGWVTNTPVVPLPVA